VSGRVIFFYPFSKTEITGGIKTVYRQAELLADAGIEAMVFQPEGHPVWFQSRAKLLDPARFKVTPEDVLVFPEALSGQIGDMARAPMTAKKALFCQNQYYMTTHALTAEPGFARHFAGIAAPSTVAAGFLERVAHLKDVAVIPCAVDPAVFAPGEKRMEIALVPHKLPREAEAIAKIFALKYPEFASVRWTPIEAKSERETAALLARASVFLSLGALESFGLIALEAMAAGAVVAGFDGYGGREYATVENGIWLPQDHLEETADALARIVKGLETGDADILSMRKAGLETAARFTPARTCAALQGFYGRLI
jgi:hypothetical protein